MKRFKIYHLLFFALLTASCRKNVTVAPPANELVTSVVFSDSADATAAVLGLYVKIMNYSTELNLANGGLTVYTGLSSDELLVTTGDPATEEFADNSISAITNRKIGSFWSFGYQLIYQANACLEGLQQNELLLPAVRDRLMGEARVVRALTYLQLSSLFGAVPLVTSTDYHDNALSARTSVTQILEAVVTDLKEAQDLLPEAYLSVSKTRPNRWTATALLSRALLYMERWQEASAAATSVLNASSYTLEPDLNNVFVIGNREAIWQLPPLQPGYQTAEGTAFIPESADQTPNYPVNMALVQAFDAGDLRRTQWMEDRSANGQLYTIPYKYKRAYVNGASPTEYYSVVRLAELVLIRAEARCHLQDGTGARSDLNRIRERAGLQDNPDTDVNLLLVDVAQQRRLELFCEGGHRWIDLRRTGNIDEVLGPVKGADWQPADALYPIPFAELQLNPHLIQNPGY